MIISISSFKLRFKNVILFTWKKFIVMQIYQFFIYHRKKCMMM